MTLHLTAFVEGKSPRLLEETCWETDLANVMDQTAKARQLTLRRFQAHTRGDVVRIDGNGR
jgi:hypothetical protein